MLVPFHDDRAIRRIILGPDLLQGVERPLVNGTISAPLAAGAAL
jgi:hypothetical protein